MKQYKTSAETIERALVFEEEFSCDLPIYRKTDKSELVGFSVKDTLTYQD